MGPSAGALRLAVGVYLLLCVALLAVAALAIPVALIEPTGQYVTVNFGMPLLFLGLIVTAGTRLERVRVWDLALIVGAGAALISWIYTTGNGQSLPSICGVLFYNHGFPFSWFEVLRFYQNPKGPICAPPLSMSPRLDGIAFFLDVFYYVGAFFGSLETTQGLRLLYRYARYRT